LVEGSSPDFNIRNCIISPEGKIILSCDYCVDPNAEVELENGLKVPIKILKNNPQKIKTPQGYKTAFNFHYTGKKKVCIITLKSGKTVKCSEDHKFKIKDKSGNYVWKKVKDILPSDSIQEL
ncbi:MAG: hypothetical protein ACOC1K_04975, partial [Nanoarchaeota archaeon]